jgi:hypothetical protein
MAAQWRHTLISIRYCRARSVLRKRPRHGTIQQDLSHGDHEGSIHRKYATYFSRPLVRACLSLLILLTLTGIRQWVYASGASAPKGPGAASNWTPSNNTLLGTAANTTSDVWFTGYNGIIGEVFYPTADTPNTTDLQFLIGDSAHTWVDEEKIATTSSVQLYYPQWSPKSGQ